MKVLLYFSSLSHLTFALESPLRPCKNLATSEGFRLTNPFLVRYSTPCSGFRLKRFSPTRYCRFLKMSSSLLSGGNCIKLGLPGKLILRDYFQENRTSRRPLLSLRISFPGRPIFIQFVPGRFVFSGSDVIEGVTILTVFLAFDCCC